MSYFDFYRTVNDLSPSGRRSHWLYLDLTLARWLPPASKRPLILDIGCGAGIVLEWLAARGYLECRGVDIDADQVRFANGLGASADFTDDVVGWLSRQPPSEFIIMKDVLEHIAHEESARLLRAIQSNLAAQGLAYIVVPNANAAFATRWRYIDATHLRSYTEVSLRANLANAGLALERIIGDDVWATRSLLGHCQQVLKRIFRLMRRLEASAEFGVQGWRMPLSLNLIAIVRRGTQ